MRNEHVADANVGTPSTHTRSAQGCSASPQSEENLFVWNATVFGPDETPWEGGVFSLRITFSDQYPEKPPRVRFTSEMFHPNVYSDGTLCMDIIQDRWSPCHSISTVLTSIQVSEQARVVARNRQDRRWHQLDNVQS